MEKHAWFSLCPAPLSEDEVLAAIASRLDSDEVRDKLQQHEREQSYPRSVLEALHQVGLGRLLAEAPDEPSKVTAWHLTALNALTSRVGGGLAITVGVHSLALLPVYIGSKAEQRSRVFSAIRAGAIPAMLLTEWQAGSDLLANQTRAEPGIWRNGVFEACEPAQATHLRLTGEKDLINGGTEADLLVTLARSGDPVADPESPFGAVPPFTLCVVERGEGVAATQAWRTLPAAASDISGVSFDQAMVPVGSVLGGVGDGFALVQQVLTLSRGGIASLAAGAAQCAWELGWSHARERRLYGQSIVQLEAIAAHTCRLWALNQLTAALAVKAAAFMNARGQAAAYYTAAAKLACCRLAEQAVDEGRQILGARALLEDLPYARLVRDVLLYGVFDGTSHLMMNHVQSMLLRARARPDGCVGELTAVYATAPQRIVEAAARRKRPIVLPAHALAEELAALEGELDLSPLVALARGLDELVGLARAAGTWGADQEVRFAVAGCAAKTEALLALVELTDRRAALGLPSRTDPLGDAGVPFAVAWFGAITAGAVRQAAAEAGVSPPAAVLEAEEGWAAQLRSTRESFASVLRAEAAGSGPARG